MDEKTIVRIVVGVAAYIIGFSVGGAIYEIMRGVFLK